MDILFAIENANLRGGTEILAFNLMHGLRAKGRGCKILSITPYEGEDNNVTSLSQEEYQTWQAKVHSLWNKLLFNKISDKLLSQIIRRKIEELKPRLFVNHTYDLITALPTDVSVAQVFHWSVVGYESSLNALIRKKNTVTRLVSALCEQGKRIRRHRILARIPKLVVLTEAAKDELKNLNTKVQEEQLIVIPDFLMVSEDSGVHSSLHNNNVSFVGRLSHEKGVIRLLRIWERVSHKMPELTLSIYGEGNARDEMVAYIREKNLRNVVFKGFCVDLKKIYTNSDMLLMTSDTEGFGMVLIEAMYFGVPCISFDCPISPKEIM